MVATFAYRQSYPANIVLLTLFSFCEAVAVGAVVSFYDSRIVLQALVITTFLFVGLTLFAMQTKYDLIGLGGILYACLLGFLGVGLVGLFLPFGHAMDVLYSGLGVLLFSGYVLYDTQVICTRLSPDGESVLCVLFLCNARHAPAECIGMHGYVAISGLALFPEWVLAVVSLYLDILNIFLSLLRLLNSTQDN